LEAHCATEWYPQTTRARWRRHGSMRYTTRPGAEMTPNSRGNACARCTGWREWCAPMLRFTEAEGMDPASPVTSSRPHAGRLVAAAALVLIAALTLSPAPQNAALAATTPLSCLVCGDLGGI